MHILIHKIVSLTTKFDWKTQNSDYLLEIKLANRGATTEICCSRVLKRHSKVGATIGLRAALGMFSHENIRLFTVYSDLHGRNADFSQSMSRSRLG